MSMKQVIVIAQAVIGAFAMCGAVYLIMSFLIGKEHDDEDEGDRDP